MIKSIPGQSIFSMLLCYLPGCPDSTMWNQTIPGMPYVPELTIYQDNKVVGEDLYIKTIDIPYDGTVYMTLAAVS